MCCPFYWYMSLNNNIATNKNIEWYRLVSNIFGYGLARHVGSAQHLPRCNNGQYCCRMINKTIVTDGVIHVTSRQADNNDVITGKAIAKRGWFHIYFTENMQLFDYVEIIEFLDLQMWCSFFSDAWKSVTREVFIADACCNRVLRAFNPCEGCDQSTVTHNVVTNRKSSK